MESRRSFNGNLYIFRSNERRLFAAKEHKLLYKQIYTYDFFDVAGSKIVEIESKDMVSNYMWRFRRSDAYLRNDWSNYTNWPYKDIVPQSISTILDDELPNPAYHQFTGNIGTEREDENGSIITLEDYPVNLKHILLELGITMDGVYRGKIIRCWCFINIWKNI